MLKYLPLLLAVILISGQIGFSQDATSPYNAKSYWEAEQNVTYQSILGKINNSVNLNPAEEQYYQDYREYLKSYFAKLNETEQVKYFEFKTQWDEEYETKLNEEDSDVTETNRLGVNPGKKFLLSNGLFGLAYGLAIDGLLELDNAAAVAVPILATGISLSVPLISKKKYAGINFGTVMLARHGKSLGAIHGAALGLLIVGDPNDTDNGGKVILASALIGSIAGGEIAFQLGKKHNWSEGRIATNRYYGIFGPWVGFSTLAAFNIDEPRVYGIAIPAAGALSYFAANKIYNKYNFTRGDMLAATSFGILSTGFGFGLVPVDEPWQLAVPGAMSLLGTVANHAMLKNTKFTSKQGWNVNYATAATTILALGIVVLINPQTHNAYFIVPSVVGMGTWAFMTQAFKKSRIGLSGKEKDRWADFSFNFTPQNYFINKQIKPNPNKPEQGGLSMFNLSLAF